GLFPERQHSAWRQDSFINDWNCVRCICHSEADGQSIVIPLNSSVLDESANPKCSANRSFPGRNLRRTEKENEIVFESGQHQPRGETQRSQATTNKNDSLM